MERRPFLLVLLAGLVSACSPVRDSPHPAVSVPEPPKPGDGSRDLTPSEIVEKFRLQPTEFSEDVPVEMRIESALDYLRRLEMAAREATYLSLPTLGSLRIIADPQTDPRAFPFSYPPDSTIADLLRDSLDRINRNDDTMPSITFRKSEDQNTPVFATGAVFNNINGIWVPRYIIEYNPAGITERRDRNELARRDASLTDAELAFTILHEISHTWQIQYFVNKVNNDKSLSLTDDYQVSDWIYQRSEEAIQKVRQRYNERSASDSYNTVEPNEAQANALILAGLDCLYSLYGSSMPDGVGAIHGGLHPTSVWGFYQAYVVNGPDGALDPKWVSYSGRHN